MRNVGLSTMRLLEITNKSQMCAKQTQTDPVRRTQIGGVSLLGYF